MVIHVRCGVHCLFSVETGSYDSAGVNGRKKMPAVVFGKRQKMNECLLLYLENGGIFYLILLLFGKTCFCRFPVKQ